MRRTGLIAFSFCLLSVAGSALAGDWTEFRGSSGQGHSDVGGLPIAWDKEKNVLWKTPLAGLGWSSPIVLGKQIFVTTAVSPKADAPLAPDQSLRLLSLDLDTGKILWDNEVFQQTSAGAATDKVHGKNSQASPTPITDGKHVFVHFGTRGTACFTLDGQAVWKNQELKYAPVHGNGGSPILVDDLLIVSCDGGDTGFITAIDKTTGKVRWKTARTVPDLKRTFAFGTPLLIEVDGQRQVVSQAAGAVYGYDPKTGAEIWKARYGDGYSVIPRPVFAQGLLFVGTGYDQAKLIAVDPSGKGDVTETHIRWTLTRGAPHTPSPVVVGEEVYVVSDAGIATCIDAKTGKTHWQERLGGKYSASPLFANGLLYFQAEEGEGIVIRPGREFKEVGRNQLEGRTFASYAVAGPTLLIRTEKQLYRIGDVR